MVIEGEADPGVLYRDTIERYFLFEKDVCSYIEGMYERANRLRSLKLEYAAPNLSEDDRKRLRGEIVKDQAWFEEQSVEMIKVFSKDLSIKTLRY